MRVSTLGLVGSGLLLGCGSSSSDLGGTDSTPSDATSFEVSIVDASEDRGDSGAGPFDALDAAIDAPAPKPAVLPWSCKKTPTVASSSDECGNDSWCTWEPSPTGRNLRTVWVNGPSDVWAAGADGGFLHWNGANWTRTSSGSGFMVRAFAKHPTEGLWALDDRCNVLKLSGTSWVPSAAGKCTIPPSGVWIGAADDVWAVGGYSGASHWNGSSWVTVSMPTTASTYAVHGLSKGDVWAVGENASVARWNGAAWSSLPQPYADMTYPTLRAIWGAAPDQMWTGGTGKTVFRWNGSSWTSYALPGAANPIGSIWGTAADDVWFAEGNGESAPLRETNVFHWDGVSITRSATLPGAGVARLHGDARTNVWGVGPAGTLVRWNGTTWTSLHKGTTATIESFWGAASNDVWAAGRDAGGGVILHFDGTTWSEHTHFAVPMHSLWGLGPDDIWAGSPEHVAAHWDGKTWSTSKLSAGLYAMWGAATDDVWAISNAGLTRMQHWDGLAWSDVALPDFPFQLLSGISGSSSNDVWVIGEGRDLLHWNGSTWSVAPSTPAEGFAAGLWAFGPKDLWSTDFGPFVHWEGTTWTALRPPLGEGTIGPSRLWAFAPNDLWSSGGGGDLVDHWDGSSVKRVAPRLGQLPRAFWGCSSDELWTGGANGVLARRKL